MEQTKTSYEVIELRKRLSAYEALVEYLKLDLSHVENINKILEQRVDELLTSKSKSANSHDIADVTKEAIKPYTCAPIEEPCELSAFTTPTCVKSMSEVGINSLSDLLEKTEQWLLDNVKGFKEGRLNQLKNKLKAKGMSLSRG
jgi:hypothetical protein